MHPRGFSSFLRHGIPVRPPAIPCLTVVEFFEKKIRPFLVDNCYKCHSTAQKKKGGLLLDSRRLILDGGDTGPAIVPGDPANSLLIRLYGRMIPT